MESAQNSPIMGSAEPHIFTFEDHSDIHETLPVGEEITVWMVPGKLIELPYEVHLGTEYIDDKPVLHCYIGLSRRQNLEFNDRNQIDLSGSINLIITLLATRHDQDNGQPIATVVTIGRAAEISA